MDLSVMSLSDLKRLQSRISTEIKKRSDVERRLLLKQFRKMAADKGLTLEDLVEAPSANKTASRATNNDAPAAPRRGRKPGVKKTEKAAAKYFHPDDPSIGWSGHGRRPQWVLNWLNEGKALSDLERK
jgi:DNA-binding protein H-NS